MQSSNLFSSYTTATPPASAFSPPPGASPAQSYVASTPRPRYLSPAPSQSIPRPHQQRSRSSGAGSMSKMDRSGISGSLEDPVLEARRVVALLVGVSGREGEGLLGELEKGFESVFRRWEYAFEEGGAGSDADGPSLNALISTLGTLISILRSSPVGGYAQPVDGTVPGPGVSALQMEQTSTQVQRLFRERQRGKEGADIAGSVLGSMG